MEQRIKSILTKLADVNGLEPLLTVGHAAAYLSLTTKRVHELVREGKLACVQISAKERRFLPSQLHAFVQSRTVTPPKPLDRSAYMPVPSTERDTKPRRGDSRASLRKEMRTWR